MTIGELRSAIDDIDSQIVRLLARRRLLAIEIGTVKRQLGKPCYDPQREQQVLSGVARLAAQERLPAEQVEIIYRHIVAMCRAAQEQKLLDI